MTLDTVFRAGFVRRWHTNPDLAQTGDRLDGHQGRVARLLLALWPSSSREILIAALTHDDGESVVGDMPATVKGAGVTCAAEDFARQAIWGPDPGLANLERARLKFCDRLDAFMWARHHAPQVLDGDGWPECARWLLDEASRLGVSNRIGGMVAGFIEDFT